MTEEERLRKEQEERERIAASGFTPEEAERIAASQPTTQAPAQPQPQQPQLTRLSDQDEAQFRTWYGTYSTSHNVDPNPDNPGHNYDYRGWWRNASAAERTAAGSDGASHLPDTYKLPGHETFSDESIYHDPSRPETTGGHWNPDGTFTRPGQVPAAQAAAAQPAYRGPIDAAYGGLADVTEQTAQDLANTYRSIGQTQIGEMEAATGEYKQSTSAADKARQERVNAVLGNLEAIISGSQNRIDEANEQAERERRAALNASKWTGLTELAASIANLVGVGGFNAVSQQYKSVQNDWMKKAEDDMRAHRSRIDNLNARLEDQRMRLEQLKMGDAQSAFESAMRIAETNLNSANNRATVKAGTEREAAQAVAQGKQAAAQARAQGAVAQNEAEETAAARRQQIGLQYEELRQNGAYRGLMKDASGDWVQDPDAVYSGYNGRNGRNGSSGSSSGNTYYISDGQGGKTTINLNTETYKQGLLSAKAEIKKDVEKILKDRNDARLKANPRPKRRDRNAYAEEDNEYTEVLNHLNGTGDVKADNEAIEAFVQSHLTELPGLGRHLAGLTRTGARVATSAQNGTALPQTGDELFDSL